MARGPQSAPVMMLIVIGICQLLQPARSYATHQQLERLLGNIDYIDDENGDQLYEEEVSRVAKRESKGSCTCTCETRPATAPSAGSEHSSAPVATSGIVQHPTAKLQSENRVPESAALMRTVMTGGKDMKSKQQQQPRGDSRPLAQQRTSEHKAQPRYGHIIKVPPAHDFEMPKQSTNDIISNEPEVEAEVEKEDVKQNEEDQSRNQHQETWALGSRYPWERLPDTMCFREHCNSDRDCCRRFNICDRSAHVCVDCWYSSSCTSERDCCLKYKYCLREWKTNPLTGKQEIVGGKCVSEL